jgi:mannose/cellobiose epimerase-like protein (N-acyl-D-glucosamine 2-epimerase family)
MRAILSIALLLAPSGSHIDREWFRKTLIGETAHWRDAASTPSGFFQPSLDRQWRPVGEQMGTLVSQCRLLFVMATGYEVTREVSYLEAVRKGADFLLAHFRDPQYGGWFWSVSPEGKALDTSKDSYGHAFVIFGLSHAARVTGEERYRKAALETWAEMKAHLRDSAGFIKPRTSRDFSQVRGTNSQNPMMHLFEALLALHDATGSPAVFQDAQVLADAIFGKLFQEPGGYLPELYDADWKPLPAAQRGYLELGHQFEWAFLLSHAVEKGFPRRYLGLGQRLLDYGMKVAYDPEAGGIFSRGDYHGGAVRGPKGWWEQAEFLRALMHYAVLRRRANLWAPFDQSLEFVKRNFIDAEYGGWYGAYDPKTPIEGRRAYKGSVWMVGYHVSGMYAEALRLSRKR